MILARRDGRPLVVGHRGAPVAAPENTVASFAAAVAAGADAVELDVVEGLLVAHSLREQAGERLSLDDALAFFRGNDTIVHLDLKPGAATADVAAAVRRHGLERRAFVSSTSPRALRRLAAVAPALPRAVSYPHDRFRLSRVAWPAPVAAVSGAAARTAMPARAPALLRAARATALSLHRALVSARVLAAVRARGAALLAWTVNDPVEVERLARLGVDAIVTDDPEMAVATLSRL